MNRYVQHVFAKYDSDGSGTLEAAEWKRMGGAPATIDYNADGVITRDELAAFWADYGRNRRMRLTGSMVDAVAEAPLLIPTAEHDARAAAGQTAEKAAAQAAEKTTEKAAEQAPAKTAEKATQGDSVLPLADPDGTGDAAVTAEDPAGEPSEEPVAKPAGKPEARRFATPRNRLAGLPAWFLAKDLNGDGQVTAAEYAPNASEQRLAEFARFDRNRDGVVTPEECPR